MRFLIVHKNYATDAKDLIAGSGVNDVKILLVSGENEPKGEAEELLKRNPGASVAVVSVNRKYKKALAEIYEALVEQSVETVKGGHAALLQWIRGASSAAPAIQLPSEAFRAEVAREPKLILAHKALVSADAVAQHRYPFTNRAAKALAEYAKNNGVAPEGLDRFFQDRRLHFAPNGQVEASLSIQQQGKKEIVVLSQWHLKEGDNTTPESAARIYFVHHSINGATLVFVSYCGPHPPGSFKATALL